MTRNRNHIFHRILAIVVFAWSVLYPGSLFAGGGQEPIESAQRNETAGKGEYPQYLSLVDGLHVTGTPREVDIDTYRLQIVGLVDQPGTYSFEQIKAMPSEDIIMSLVCPGFFEDTGVWSGTRLATLLKQHGVKEGARTIKFVAIDGSYDQVIDLSDVYTKNILLAWEFDGSEFPVYHGFPLRIAVDDLPGAVWVKWLEIIEVK